MIPPSLAMRQAAAIGQRMLPQQRPEDPLLKALSQQAMAGEMIKETASHKMKMLKLRQKYAPEGQPQAGGY